MEIKQERFGNFTSDGSLIPARFTDAILAPFYVSVPNSLPAIKCVPLIPHAKDVPHNPMHYHDCFELMWFFGEPSASRHYIDDAVFRPLHGELHFVPIARRHRIIDVDGNNYGAKLDFSWDVLRTAATDAELQAVFSCIFLRPWISGDLSSLRFHIPLERIDEMNRIFLDMCDTCDSMEAFFFLPPSREKEDLCRREIREFSKFLAIFRELFDATLTARERALCEKYAPPLIAVLNYIHDNLSERITLRSICDTAGFKPSWFSRIFREIFSFQVMDYVNFIRISKARGLLTNSARNVYEIGEECGFNSAIYFDRVFKMHTGCTPKYFRNEYEYYIEHLF